MLCSKLDEMRQKTSEVNLRWKGRAARGLNQKTRVFAADRRCQKGDCPTRLSIHNPADLCFAHAPKRFRRMRIVGRRDEP